MKRLLALALLLLALLPSARGQALISDFYQLVSFLNPDPNSGLTTFPSLLIPMGGLQEGMGTAYSAVGKDSSYFESNPAASSSLEYTELAVYHNNWIADTRIEGAVYTIRYKGLGFGAGGKWLYLYFPATDDFGGRNGAGYYSEAMVGFNVSYNFFSSYNFNGLALAATAGNSGLGLMVDGGLLTRFNALKFYPSRSKNCGLALTLKNFGPPVLRDPLPTRATFGLAYSPLRPFTFSLDLTQPINLAALAKSERPYFAVGILANVTSFFRLQGGLLMKGADPRISLGSSFELELMRVSVNYTLDLTTQFTPLNRISIQASFALGDGGRADLAKKVDTLYLNGLDAYARGDNKGAVVYWTEAVRLDPTFDPAQESLLVVQAAVLTEQKMEKLQTIETK
jgi:hypothetical protein